MATECNIFRSVHLFGVSEQKIREVVFFVFESLKKNGSISVHLVGDRKIKSLNNKYRGKNTTTDVLSFAMEGGRENFVLENDLGDIFVCIPQIRRQAQKFEISFLQEFYRMLIHGTLHLSGYDHVKENQTQKMFSLQEKLLKKLL